MPKESTREKNSPLNTIGSECLLTDEEMKNLLIKKVPPPENECCYNCKFWLEKIQGGSGECHKYAPRPNHCRYYGDNDKPRETMAVFPRTM